MTFLHVLSNEMVHLCKKKGCVRNETNQPFFTTATWRLKIILLECYGRATIAPNAAIVTLQLCQNCFVIDP